MGLKKTDVDTETLKEQAEEDGVGTLGLSQTQTGCQRYEARIERWERTENGVVIQVDASPLFPGGGGQPADRGTVDGQPILDVLGHQRLLVSDEPEGKTVWIEVDWMHRFDMMQQHTGQHVISAIALSRYQWSTLSFHLSEDTAFVVLDVSSLSASQVQTLEEEVNEVIRDGRSIIPRLATEADFEGQKIRCRKLPEVRAGGLRLVEIDGIDLNTCGGTHVSNTAQLQVVRLIKSESHRGATRLYFEVGGRVLRRSRWESEIHHRVNQLLSCSVSQYPESIERILKETKAAAKTIKALQLSVAEAEASQYPLVDGETLTVLSTVGRDMGQLSKMAHILRERDPMRTFVLLSQQGTDDWLVLMMGDDAWIQSAGRALLARLDAKGGGGAGRLQGRVQSDDLVRAYLAEKGA